MGVLVLGTWDSYGTEQLLMRHGPEWDGLAIDATFHNVPNDEGVTVLADTDGLVTVPPEACMRASKYATITFRGVQDGVQRISCNLPYMVLDHAQVPGANSTATPSENAQALAQMQDLRDAAVDAKRHAEAARDAAAGSAAQAEAQKTAAAKSASDAQGYMQTASGAATAANASAKNAEENAASAANAAKKAADESVAANIAVIEKMQADVASKQTAAAGDAKTASDAAAGAADAKAAAVAAQKDAAASKAAAANSSAAARTSEDAAAKSAEDADNTANNIKDSMTQISENKEAVSKLEEDTTALQKRQNVLVGSETGNPVSCDDAFAAPLCGLNVYGKSTQDGTPSPDAPVPIVSAGDGGNVTVKVTGANMLEGTKPGMKSTPQGATYTIHENGISITGTAINLFTILLHDDVSHPLTRGIYYLTTSGLSSSSALNFYFIGKFSSDVQNLKVTLTRDVDFSLRLQIGKGAALDTTIQVSLTRNKIATYSPYHEQLLTLPTPNGLPGIPVTSGGNYTDQNGQQWVCDEVDLERGVKVQRVNIVDLSTCVITGTTNLAVTKRLAIRLPLKGRDYKTEALCNKLQFLVSFTKDTLHFYVDVSSAQVFIPIGAKTPEEGEYILFYALATPIETPLTPAEIAAYKALTAYAPDTVVQASDGAGVKLEYQRDVNIAIKKLEDAIASMTAT
nr:MAG TPA: hypothetical protein [Caudoviricetes sp.]